MSSSKQHRPAFTAMGVAIASGWVFVALVPLPGTPPERIIAGLLLGTIYGQATLAAVWTAIGPFRFRYRLLLALVCLGGMFAALGILASHSPIAGTLMIGVSMVVQWVLVQVPLWCLVWWNGLRIQHVQAAAPTRSVPSGQFGIRQLMVFTAVIAVLLGVGRMLVVAVDWSSALPGVVVHEAPIFGFIVLVNTLYTLPLALAVLMRRWNLLAWFIGAAMVAAATQVEVAVIERMIQGRPNAELPILLWTMNLCQSAWVVALLAILRVTGFRLATTSQSGESPFASTG